MDEYLYFKNNTVPKYFDNSSFDISTRTIKPNKVNSPSNLRSNQFSLLRIFIKFQWVLFIVLNSFQLSGQSDFTITHVDEDDKTKLELFDLADKYVAASQFDKCYEQLENISKSYMDSGNYKKGVHYLKIRVELGRKLSDVKKEIIPLIDIISIQNVLFNGDQDYLDNIRRVSKFAENPELAAFSRSLIFTQMSKLPEHQITYDSAIIFTKKAIQLLDGDIEHKNNNFGNTIMLARYYKKSGNLLDALLLLLDTESKLNFETHSPSMIYKLYFQLANIFKIIEDFPKAKSYKLKALDFAKLNNLKEMVIQSQSYLGGVEFELGNTNEAIYLLEDALKKIKTSRFKRDKHGLFISLANIYLVLDSLDKTAEYLDSASATRHLVKSIPLQNNLNEVHAAYFIKIGNKEKSKQHIDLLTEQSKRKYKLLYLFHKKFKNEKLSLLYYEKFIFKRDSTKANNKLITIQRIESEFNRKQQNSEIQSLTLLNSAQDKALSVRNTALIMGSIMLLILASLLFLLYRLFIKNQENQKELAKQNKQISEALAQNQILIKEIHHRVKNNLQVVSSLLSMQERKVQDKGTKDALKSSKSRVQSMSILHQNLYSGENLKDIDVDDYINKLVQNIFDTYNTNQDIQFNIEIDPISMDVDTLVPLGLISNELICNALKHAFDGIENGKLDISLKSKGNQMILKVADNGVGFEGDKIPSKEGSLGSRLIQSFTQRLDGKIEIDKTNGTSISIIFEKDKLNM